MYILSRDRLNMDLDRSCLELMIRLLELEQDDSVADQLTAKEMSRVKEKIRKLCETVHNKHLDLENITVSDSCFSHLTCQNQTRKPMSVLEEMYFESPWLCSQRQQKSVFVFSCL